MQPLDQGQKLWLERAKMFSDLLVNLGAALVDLTSYIFGWSIGYKTGKSIGFRRGKAVGRAS